MRRRHLGGGRPFRVHFHADEKKWLYEEHLRFERKCRANKTSVDFTRMKWVDFTRRFNHHFAGKFLPGVAEPRPSRTAPALRTEKSRIPAIKKHMEKMSQVKEAQTIGEETHSEENQEDDQEAAQEDSQE